MAAFVPVPFQTFGSKPADLSKSRSDKSGPYAHNLDIDALIVGAGFSGIFMLKTLRDRGFKSVIYEAGHDIGGTWRWNCYPGAGTDSEVPEYEFSWPEVWKTWEWTSNHPDYREIRAYFDHVDKVVGVRKNCSFGTLVVGADFDVRSGRWTVRTQDGRHAKAKYLILGTGISAKHHVPDWPGMDKYKGEVHHSSHWPEKSINVKDKRCAVIGTGTSSLQLVQAWGPMAGNLTVFQRTPNLALPMHRRPLTCEDQERKKVTHPLIFEGRETTFAGERYDFSEKNALDETPEQREAFYERLWQEGGFRFFLASYKDFMLTPEANRLSYHFWAEKTRTRIQDARKRNLLAPLEMPHYFGAKRPGLEVDYYEQFNRPNVDIVDVRQNAIREFTESGVMLQDGTHHEFDVVAIATGFDIVTGSMTQLGLNSINNTKLEEEWTNGISTFLGISVRGFPNMFYTYGPHSPCLLSNALSTIEVQGRWIGDMIDKMKRLEIKYINPRREATEQWRQRIMNLTDLTILPTTRSTFMGGNVPGKKFETMCYAGGLGAYRAEIQAAMDSMQGFEVVKTDTLDEGE